MRYVTYDQSGALTGCYLQELQPEHEHNHIEMDESLARGWTQYRANAARDGIEPVPPVAPSTIVPTVVPRRRALQALRLAGITSGMIETALANALTGVQLDLALIEFHESLEFERDRPLVKSLGPLLGLTAEQIDVLFIQAAALP